MILDQLGRFLLLQVSLGPKRLDLEAVGRGSAEDARRRRQTRQLAERLHHFGRRSHLFGRHTTRVQSCLYLTRATTVLHVKIMENGYGKIRNICYTLGEKMVGQGYISA